MLAFKFARVRLEVQTFGSFESMSQPKNSTSENQRSSVVIVWKHAAPCALGLAPHHSLSWMVTCPQALRAIEMDKGSQSLLKILIGLVDCISIPRGGRGSEHSRCFD